MSAPKGLAALVPDDDRTDDALEAGTEEGDALRGCTEALVRHFAASPEDGVSLLRFARAMVARGRRPDFTAGEKEGWSVVGMMPETVRPQRPLC
ncbi:hypothetical protein CKO25_07185 [Thiocapsa imhoffii]|uniref:Uncharacterized protein n=1 Tax=Thiocapsa imhoffii TaxID=382777 RepID=A0A9X0WH59_9GAMM|nr:hypothetical protein [Thiocapsa imhoffii]MBK1644441.1 hypothetical protein [Thiocapsa imhoffii]